MILPLLVFLVVLIAVLVSFKTEHFQGAQTTVMSPSARLATTPAVLHSHEDKNTPNTTYISFLVDNSSGKYSEVSSDTSFKTNLENLIVPRIITEFNDMDLDGGDIQVLFKEIESNTPTQPTGATTIASIDKSEVTIVIPKYYTQLQYTPHINNLKSSFFGDLHNRIALTTTTFLQMYPFDNRNYINVVSVEREAEDPKPTPTVVPKPTRASARPLTDEEKLSKKACVDKEKNCNIGFKPYSMFEFNSKNPATNKPYTENEKQTKIEQLNERCENEADSEQRFCCDPNDYKLQAVYSSLPRELRQKYKKIAVDKCNNTIKEIKVCDGDNCNPQTDIIRPAKAYELCKLQKVTDNDIGEDGVVPKQKLVPDCYEGKCVNSFKLLDINPDDSNEKITNHYYLIDAVKNNDISYIKSYFSDRYNNVNESLEYGYPGNTILHQVVYDGMNEILDYLLTLKVDLSKVNKDGNSVLHIASFKGNYNGVHRLIKLGASVNCENNMGDTPLHCAVRSGSYNTTLILINNGASAVLSIQNKHGETPLHTAVVSKKKNLKIIQLLVENGSNVHNINKYKKTVLASLKMNHLPLQRNL